MPPPHRRRAAALSVLTSYSTTAFGALSGLLLVPLYLRHFSLATYGAWLASGGLAGMLALADGGLSTVLAQRLAAGAGAGAGRRVATAAASGWALSAAVGAIVALATWGVADQVPAWVRAPPADAGALRQGFVMAGLATGLWLMAQHLFYLGGAFQRTRPALVSTWAALVGGVVATLGGLHGGLGVAALGLGLLVRSLVALGGAAGTAAATWRAEGLPAAAPAAAEMAAQLRLMAPMLLGRAVGVVLTHGEPALVAALYAPEAAAVLGLTGKAFGLCQMLVNPLTGGALMGLSHLAAAAPAARLVAVARELAALSATAAAAAIGVAVVLNPLFVPLWSGPAAWGGHRLNAAMAVACLLATRANCLGMLLAGLGVLRAPALVAVGEGLLRLALLAWWLPSLGLVAVPLAAAAGLAGLHLPIFGWLLGRRLAPLPPAALLAAGGAAVAAAAAAAVALAPLAAAVAAWGHSWPRLALVGVAVAAPLVGATAASSAALRQQLRRWRPAAGLDVPGAGA